MPKSIRWDILVLSMLSTLIYLDRREINQEDLRDMAGFGMAGTAVFYQDGTNIDRRQCHRIVPMKVLVLGLCRTGTMSVRLALRSLGYLETYHMRAASTETPRDCEMWVEAIRAKYHGEGFFEKEDWDQLLGHCQAVCDFPAAAFAPELIAAYPNAKVILTNRDVDSWHASCTKTIYQGIRDPSFRLVSKFDWAFRLYRPMLITLWDNFFCNDFEGKGKEIYAAHYAQVRSLVPPERLLEYSVEDGWGPLCKFLGEELPSTSFPVTNSADEFVLGLKARNQKKVKDLQLKTTKAILGLAILGIGLGYINSHYY